MIKAVKLILLSIFINLSLFTQLSAAKINGVFFERNCDWYASEINNTQSLLGLLYISKASREALSHFNMSFFITFIIDDALTSTYGEDWDHRVELKIDGKSYTVEGGINIKPEMYQFVLRPEYFEQINEAMKAGNTVRFQGLEDAVDQYFSLKGYTKTALALSSPCDKQ